ncbi:MAG: tRNA (N(6)-L-threonylcarbamoyladenosine(37)-C(2))-methylthiotransferase MtaB [Candidatus Omnitrophica bacterium]|nr:tRNA (N(6)-L-threonylcarbamoyladenosine(37)-C(2))-methylthiotransferase MtaB [Candidatus Omnitrophota bacterium]
MKTVKFYTLGCKVNQYETQAMREQVLGMGFKEIDRGVPADVYVVNTCTVTHNADNDSLGAIRRAKRENPRASIIAAGCLSELDAARIKSIDKNIIVIKNKEKGSVARFLQQRRLRRFSEITKQRNNESANQRISFFKNHTRAFLKVQDGCNNFCSYCKVPLVRGRSISRPLDDALSEAQQLADHGYKEIVLTGICLGVYGRDFEPKRSLSDLVALLEKIDGLKRIRLSSIEISDVSDELIDVMAKSKKICRHLHIPLQSGDDGVLRKMKRPYDSQGFVKRIQYIRRKMPLLALTTDVMVGFPGESEPAFHSTLAVVKKMQPLKVHIFPFSARLETKAALFEGRVALDEVKQRMQLLKDLAIQTRSSYIKKLRVKNIPLRILLERKYRDEKGAIRWQGYTDEYIPVSVKGIGNLKNKVINRNFSCIRILDEV